jgi:hydroxysqualene synthase
VVGTAASRRLEHSYAACEALARAHYENFPVASRLLPSALRRHIAAIYAFARIADDFADEPGRPPDERLRLLDDWRAHLHSVPPSSPAQASSPHSAHPDLIFPAVHDTILRFELPVSLFEDLLSAFRQDVTTSRYDTWEDVLDYCRRSANPVGRLVLRLARQHDTRRDTWSDDVCTALQLTNFWQDLAVDWERGRLYVPDEAWRGQGALLADLETARWSPSWASVLGDASGRTRAPFLRGRPICDAVTGRLRYELRATWHGGMRILERLDQSGSNPFHHRPSLGRLDMMVVAWRTLAWTPDAPAED